MELGVGVVIPEAKPAAAQAAWPRAFTVRDLDEIRATIAAARAVPRGALRHTLGT